MKDHEFREQVGELKAIVDTYKDTQQLRERLRIFLSDFKAKVENKEMSIERIKAVIEQYQERLRGNIMEDGRMRWDYYGVQRRIAQAAFNYNGYIVTGTRHGCPIMRMQIDMIDGLDEWCGFDKMVQGFTCQYGFFLTRKEAYPIAKAAGQIIREDHCPGTLYSECYI